jgi:ABC-type nickel/cobalt efflux system permease component RcnA
VESGGADVKKLTLAAGVLVAAVLAVGWLSGWIDWLTYSAIGAQREFQTALAGAIGRLKAAEPGATLGLVGLCFGYGVLHAAGPGHGKMLVGGYALANRVQAVRLVAIAVAASLAQAATAVVLVYAGVLLFSWTSKQMVGMAEQSMTVASYAGIGAIGLFVGARGLKALAAPREGDGHAAASHPHGEHGPHPGHGAHDCDCGHSHGPDLASVQRVRTLRDALPLIAAVAVRPCTGAIFLLILCWRIGADAAGVAGTFAMGLGTAVVTVGAAFLAVTMREGAWATGLDTAAMRRVMGGVGVLVGLVLLSTSVLMLRVYL